MILAIPLPVDRIGVMSLIDNEPRSATVQAEILTDELELARANGTTAWITDNKHAVR